MNKIHKRSVLITLAYATDSYNASGTVKINGILKGVSLVVPNLNSSNTVKASILDEQGGTIWTKSTIADSATTSVYVDSNSYYFSQPLHGTVTLALVTSGGQTADRSFVFHVYFEV